ncbi:hypothetical protein [uncultured Sphingomonas sp.]|uniref:hypothetical protein n=1 Tax=uncultured Sphingomonas sp. TaxID=158754 RepID=UPI0035C95D72
MTAILLDPFGFQPALASKVSGLGGNDPGPDPAYVFHTPYIALPEPAYELAFAFSDLRASGGALVIRVNAIADRPGAQAAMVATEQFRLPDLARRSGGARLRFDAGPARRYAVLGHFYADELASATRLTLELTPIVRPIEEAPSRVPPTAAAETNMLIVRRPPSLAVPLSQHATVRQQAEAERSGNTKPWIVAFVDRVRAAYAIRTDAALAAVGPIPADLAASLAQHAAVAHHADADTLAPADWLIVGIEDAPGPPSDAPRQALAPLRPGGIGLVLLPLAIGDPPPGAFAFSRVQRLAVEMLSYGYNVTQIAVDLGDAVVENGVTPFVMIVRR